jgi:LysR family transcriptional regulator, low CO2-responsive transcriptional regulator
MTLAQLQSFVLAARLGSVKAAAAELGVTEAAVSVAVAALRKELGDELFVREGRGIALTAGGRRLTALASEILDLAQQARRSVQDTPGQARQMQIAATHVVAEHLGPLVDAFTADDPQLEVSVESARGADLANLLEHRRADIAFGPAPKGDIAATIAAVPFLRARLIVVAAPGHPLAAGNPVSAAEAAAARWLLGPSELDPTTGAGLLFARLGIEPGDTVGYTSSAGAIAAAVAGDGPTGSSSPSPTPSSPRSGGGRWSASTCRPRRWSRSGTHRRSASAAACRPRWRCSDSRSARKRRRRSRPGGRAPSPPASSRDRTSRFGVRSEPASATRTDRRPPRGRGRSAPTASLRP